MTALTRFRGWSSSFAFTFALRCVEHEDVLVFFAIILNGRVTAIRRVAALGRGVANGLAEVAPVVAALVDPRHGAEVDVAARCVTEGATSIACATRRALPVWYSWIPREAKPVLL